jgi:hypothetical protein
MNVLNRLTSLRTSLSRSRSLLAQDHQRRGGVRHTRLERRDQRDAHIRIAYTANRFSKPLEAGGEVGDVFSPLRVAKQRKNLAPDTLSLALGYTIAP